MIEAEKDVNAFETVSMAARVLPEDQLPSVSAGKTFRRALQACPT
jgi:hypothetical protein